MRRFDGIRLRRYREKHQLTREVRAMGWFTTVEKVAQIEAGQIKIPIRCTQDVAVTMALEKDLERDVVIARVPRPKKRR